MENAMLSIENLKVSFQTRHGMLKAVDGVSFALGHGEVLGLVGESGCGKSMTVKSVLHLVRGKVKVEGKAIFKPTDGETVDLLQLDPKKPQIRTIRGKHINMIFQEPMNALSPVHTVGNQIIEALRLHTNLSKREAREKAVELLKSVGIPDPEKRVDAYSFQMSGGMRQRALIAMAIACNPELLIADEPTTVLDVSVQAQILRLLKDIQAETGMSIIFITHDLAVVAQMADRVCVMYLGAVMEEADVGEIFENPLHPYTQRLMDSVLDPSVEKSDAVIDTIPGSVPEPIGLPVQCKFYKRCTAPKCERCAVAEPPLVDVGNGHKVRCFCAGKADEKNE